MEKCTKFTSATKILRSSFEKCLAHQQEIKRIKFSSNSYKKLCINDKQNLKNHVKSSQNALSGTSSFFSSKQDLMIQPKLKYSTKINLDTEVNAHYAIQDVLRSYETRGYTQADLDPLKVPATKVPTMSPPDPLPDFSSFSEADLNRSFELPANTYIGGSEKSLTLREIITRLKKIYCGTLAVEYMHNKNIEQMEWIKKKFENPEFYQISKEERTLCLQRMLTAGLYEAFCARKWTSEKRFGLEGCDALVPLINGIMDRSSEIGVETFVIGMPHRGRLNIFTNICLVPLVKVFAQFHGLKPEEKGCGDVKYHLGTCMKVINKKSNKEMKVIVLANPSHLEAIDGVVLGRTRSEQIFSGDKERKKVMAILFHGDAAFCGQGVVYETTQFCDLPGFGTGGCIHVIVNNQIGFTAEPRFSRSSFSCADLSKVINCPIFHINAEDPDKTIPVAKAASEFRQKFGKDIYIDLVGYRRLGHNETDEPMFTNPTMYNLIRKMTPSWQSYAKRLIKEGTVTQKFVDDFTKEFDTNCQKALDESLKVKTLRMSDWIDSPWKGWFKGKDPMKVGPTGVKENVLQQIGTKFSEQPPANLNFQLHPGLDKILKARKEMISKRMANWNLAETFAWGSLLLEGVQVRLSGQDVQVGIFFQRHQVYHDANDLSKSYTPLEHLSDKQGQFLIFNSPLSEYGVLSFESGYSMTNPECLIMWEAQYGDYVNAGQPAIDLFINSGESKWIRQSGLVMLLPHGFEGKGPDHSSARVERFLQLSDEDADKIPELTEEAHHKRLIHTNWIVANCSVPSNYFHILRRQLKLPFRKPLVLFTPKGLLKDPRLVSPFDEMLEGTSFKRVIPENGPASKNPDKVKRLILCSGKVYFDFKEERAKRKLEDKVALTRIEQLVPFPYDLVMKEFNKYPKAEVFWGQEEHKNMGCWSYFRPRFKNLLKGKRKVVYCGRGPSPSVTGSKYVHLEEVKALNDSAFKNL